MNDANDDSMESTSGGDLDFFEPTVTESCSKCSFLSLEDYESAVNSSEQCRTVIEKADQVIRDLKMEVDRQKALSDQANINMSHILEQMDKKNNENQYEKLYLNLRAEYESLVLESVKAKSELDELKKTTGHALTLLGEVKEEKPLMDKGIRMHQDAT